MISAAPLCAGARPTPRSRAQIVGPPARARKSLGEAQARAGRRRRWSRRPRRCSSDEHGQQNHRGDGRQLRLTITSSSRASLGDARRQGARTLLTSVVPSVARRCARAARWEPSAPRDVGVAGALWRAPWRAFRAALAERGVALPAVVERVGQGTRRGSGRCSSNSSQVIAVSGASS